MPWQLRRLSCAGTDNKELVQSQYYVGCKHERVRGDAYYELLDEFITAAQRRCAGSKPTRTKLSQAASSVSHDLMPPSHGSTMSRGEAALGCRRFGNTVVVHFEDMAHANLDRLLSQYRGTLPCFSDDVQVHSQTQASLFCWPHLIFEGVCLHKLSGCLEMATPSIQVACCHHAAAHH